MGVGAHLVVAAPPVWPLVALTVDDGPHPSTTPALLEVLDRHAARATFFLIGERAARAPDLVRAIAAAGHELGNHLWQDQASVRLPPDEFRRQLEQVHRELEVHAPVSVFRPGHGWFTRRMLRDGADLGYRCVLGSPCLLATEYPGDPAAQGRRLGRRAHPGAIVVLHEGTESRRAAPVVADALLSVLTDRRLRAVSVREALVSRPPRSSPS